MSTRQIQTAVTSASFLLTQVEAQLEASKKRTENPQVPSPLHPEKAHFEERLQHINAQLDITEERIKLLEAKASDIPTRIELIKTYRLLYAYYWLAKKHAHSYHCPRGNCARETAAIPKVEWHLKIFYMNTPDDKVDATIMGIAHANSGIFYIPPDSRG